LLVQLMGSILVNRLNSPKRREQGDWQTATREDIAHAAREILNEGQPYFANLWAEAGQEGQRVLGAAARTAEGLAAAELARESGLAADELPGVLTRLEQYRLIELVEGRWRVQVELTRRAFVGFARSGTAR
jgi:hypothetical protein